MRLNVFLCVVFVCLLGCLASATARAQEDGSSEEDTTAAGVPPGEGMLSNPEDPQNQLPLMRQRRAEKDAVFRVSPLQEAHENKNRRNQARKEKTGFEFGWNSNSLVQVLSETLPDEDDWGAASTLDLVGTWAVLNRAKPSQGQFLFSSRGPLGLWNGGSDESGTGQPGQPGLHREYIRRLCPCIPALSKPLLANKAARRAGWAYRLGRITVDQIFSTSRHISPALTFQPISGTGPFVIGLADTGVGCGGYVVHHRSSRFDRCRARRRFQSTGLCHPAREPLYSDRVRRPDRSADRPGGLLETHPVAYGRD